MAHRFLIISEAHKYLFSKQIEGDIIAIPSEIDELTDEDVEVKVQLYLKYIILQEQLESKFLEV